MGGTLALACLSSVLTIMCSQSRERIRIFRKYPEDKITYGSIIKPHRKLLGLAKSHINEAIAFSGTAFNEEIPATCLVIQQFRKKSLASMKLRL